MMENKNENEMLKTEQDINKTDKGTKESKFWDITCKIVTPFLVIVVIFNLLFFVSRVPTGSMIPTITEDARIIVKKVFNEYDYGDIVVFYSNEYEAHLVKRLIGKPGDTLVFTEEDGIYRNGEKLEEPYLTEEYFYEVNEFTVPEGCYFFLGDNRDESVDSRYWDNPFISKKNFLGEVVLILNKE